MKRRRRKRYIIHITSSNGVQGVRALTLYLTSTKIKTKLGRGRCSNEFSGGLSGLQYLVQVGEKKFEMLTL